MLHRLLLSALLPASLFAAGQWVAIRTTDGKQIEAQIQLRSLKLPNPEQILSVHNGAPASEFEQARITAGIAAIQGTDRAARDAAVAELTAIGVPVLTPLLKTYKDTDQHEPRPLYRLFERIMPSYADGVDRTLSLIRLRNGEAARVMLPAASLELTAADGSRSTLPWSSIRTLALRQKTIRRTLQVHSLRHCTQIEYLDTGLQLTSASKIDSTARGFVRLSWDTDSWATDADGLKKPGSPAYKSNLFDGQPFGALVGRIDGGAMFFLGKSASKSGLSAGRLGVAVNDNPHWQNNLGTFYVTLTATEAYDLGDAQ